MNNIGQRIRELRKKNDLTQEKAEYFQFWKKDHEEDLEIARQAVAEYPGDCRYLYWLASNERII